MRFDSGIRQLKLRGDPDIADVVNEDILYMHPLDATNGG